MSASQFLHSSLHSIHKNELFPLSSKGDSERDPGLWWLAGSAVRGKYDRCRGSTGHRQGTGDKERVQGMNLFFFMIIILNLTVRFVDSMHIVLVHNVMMTFCSFFWLTPGVPFSSISVLLLEWHVHRSPTVWDPTCPGKSLLPWHYCQCQNHYRLSVRTCWYTGLISGCWITI